jgi:hypothetical protein
VLHIEGLRVALGLDVLSTSAGVGFTGPDERLPDERRPLLKAAERGDGKEKRKIPVLIPQAIDLPSKIR